MVFLWVFRKGFDLKVYVLFFGFEGFFFKVGYY